MIFKAIPLDGAFVIELEKHQDDRGYFARTFCQLELGNRGLNPNIAQANTALSHLKGTLRGMHYQSEPYAEIKLVRCIRGAVFDVIIDLRPDSSSYCKWFGIELTADNSKMVYVPKGFAHGYQTLMDNTEVSYLVSQFFTPEFEKGVRWNDKRFGISWPEDKKVLLSDKDRAWPDFRD
jgi:dTDP-4-dehydrorhamnose 3,5-epimerase